MEEWRDVKDHPGYQVSSSGQVRSFMNNRHGVGEEPRLLKTDTNSNGYLRVTLGSNNRAFIHRMVGEAFIPNPDNLPVIRHKDDDRTNNSVENLEWGTQSDNIKDAVQRGRFVNNIKTAKEAALKKQRKRIVASSIDGSFVKGYLSICHAARDLNLNEGNISNVLHGRQKKTGDYNFKYVDEEGFHE